MQFEFSPFVVPLVFCALISIFVAIYTWGKRSNQSAIALSVLALVIAEWCIGYALEIAAVDLAGKFLWGKLQYIGIATVPLFWLIFAYNHANPGKRLSYPRMLALAAIPFVTIVLALTMEWHKLIWDGVEIARSGSLSTLGVISRGWWFYIHFAYSYLLLLAGTVIISLWLRRVQGLYRGQAAILILSLVLAWAGNILYFMGVNPDPTPFTFTLTVLGLLWAIFGYRLVDIAPVARDLVVDGMRDGMMVLDMRGRVADINPAAAHMIGLPVGEVLGQPVGDVLAPWPHLLERFRGSMDANDEITIGQGEAARHYEVRISALSDQRGNALGRLVSVRDLDQSALHPHYAFREPSTKPMIKDDVPAQPVQDTASSPILGWLKNFISPPMLSQSLMPDDLNPSWAQTIERAVTVCARLIMVFGSITGWVVLSDLNLQNNIGYAAAILLFLAVTYFLALSRTAPFRIRVGLFVFLVYTMALAEMLKYGFSADVFLYFMALIVLAHMLLNVRGGFWMLALAVTTMIVFAWSVLSGVFVPTEVAKTTGIVFPVDMASATTSILVYLFSSLTMMTVVNMFIVNLNQAWQKESQALNLVQQERDLLELRVRQRTSDLAEARDLAVQSSNELRKYFLAIEQSGNTIVITDTKGNIEYANPGFEQVTGFSLAESMGKNLRLLKSGTQSAEFYAEMWGTITAGKIWRGELHNKRKDGSLFWESATIAPVHNQDGVITNYVAVKEDITVQKELREQLERQNEYLAALQNITLELLNRRSLDDLLNAAVERACALMDVSLGLIALRDDTENGAFIFRATTRAQAHSLGKPVVAQQMRYTARAIETGAPVIVDDYSAVGKPYKVTNGGYLHATADFPIIARGEVVGVLALGRTKENYPFTPSQIETGTLFSQMVALVLDNANLYDSALKEIEQRKQAEERNLRFVEDMKSLQEIYLELSHLQESDQLYIQMIEFAQRRLGLDRVGLFLLDEASNSIVGTYGVSPDGQVRDERYYREEVTPGHWTLEIVNSPKHTKLWENAPLFDNSGEVGTGWKVASTLWNGQKAIGYLICDTLITQRPPRTYEGELISLLGSTFGHLVERNRNQILLQESEARFRQIVENASDVIYRADIEGRFTYLNPTALNIMGFKSEADVLGRSYLELVKPEWRAKLKRFYLRQFLKGEESSYYEFESFSQDGRETWIGQNVQIIRENEKVVGFQAVARDITSLKQAQESLALARDQALDASRFKSQLLAKVSHELRTPLGAVFGYAELLQRHLFGPLNEEQQDAADNIVESANYLNTMISELLDQAQIEARSVQLRILPFSPVELVERVVGTLGILAEKKGLVLSHSISPDVPESLFGDFKRLQQILINLTGNAIKFTITGQVQIELLRPDATHWAMRVSDTGAGIPKDAQVYIFEPFRQVDNAITHYNRGTGLGLSITKQLVELMGGHIKIESEVEKGSIFTITLPIEQH